MLRQVAVGSLILLHVSTALAQPVPPVPVPPPAPPEQVPAAPEPAPAAVDPRADDAWQLYHAAFEALGAGDPGKARVLVARLVEEHERHPAAARAAVVLRALDAPPAVTIGGPGQRPGDRPGEIPPPPEGPIIEAPTTGARAELALFQTIHGMAVGAELCILVGCEGAGPVVGLVLAGAAAGAGISLGAGKRVTPGQRALINSGTLWGAANAGMLLILAEPDTPAAAGLGMLVGQGVGIAIGAGFFQTHATAGQVALANTFGIWSGAVTAGVMSALDADLDAKSSLTGLLLATDVGIAVGAALAHRHPRISRARTLVMDAGGIVGGLMGYGSGVMAGLDDGQPLVGLASVGAVVGLATAAYFTKTWD